MTCQYCHPPEGHEHRATCCTLSALGRDARADETREGATTEPDAVNVGTWTGGGGWNCKCEREGDRWNPSNYAECYDCGAIRPLTEADQLRAEVTRLNGLLAAQAGQMDRVVEERDRARFWAHAWRRGARMNSHWGEEVYKELAVATRDRAALAARVEALAARMRDVAQTHRARTDDYINANNERMASREAGATHALEDMATEIESALRPDAAGGLCSTCGTWARDPNIGDTLDAPHSMNCPKHPKFDTTRRTPGCQCQWEEGDSPCRVHGESEEPTIEDVARMMHVEVSPHREFDDGDRSWYGDQLRKWITGDGRPDNSWVCAPAIRALIDRERAKRGAK